MSAGRRDRGRGRGCPPGRLPPAFARADPRRGGPATGRAPDAWNWTPKAAADAAAEMRSRLVALAALERAGLRWGLAP